ncbi:MAG: L-glutamate gamma-semialdehyde dehydrogenase [Anaerolineae bacterium]|nr:L-glutamate gamma-semialdehyde dehydrogenase [Anaerolineae bacterium]
MQQALAAVQSEMGRTYPGVIGGERFTLTDTFASRNPARPGEVLAHFPNATVAHTDRAIEAAAAAFATWQHTPAQERSRYLLKAAADMRRRRFEFNATMVLEAGKSWWEAEIDTAEAIDFMEYYARQILRLADSSHMLTAYPPEQLQLQYIPLGVGAIIPPWNFPNAILAGMTAAAIVAGNTVVLKPAEQTPLIGWKVAELFWNAGLPDGVLNFLTHADGAVVGGRMVEHPQTRFIAFTGSQAVGVKIYETAARVQPGQKWLKRAILEMGGKNAVIVDETADLDAAAEGIVAGAFGFQGQKCSAGSRAILVDAIYDAVAQRVVAGAQQLSLGPTDTSADISLGPVIDQEAYERIRSYIDLGAREGTLLTGGQVIESNDNGYFIPPTVFGDIAADARLAQEEIFGPVLALIRAKDFDDALRIANNTAYGLTGAVFSSRRERLEQARREFHVGNLYLNRKCTGALVNVHPFGGFNMSGTDTKAGGPDYLLQFTQGKSVAEKL